MLRNENIGQKNNSNIKKYCLIARYFYFKRK